MHERINDLRSRIMQNFRGRLNASHHDANCGHYDLHSCMPCSCCKLVQTFQAARHVEEKPVARQPFESWEGLPIDDSKLIESLDAELFKSRAATKKALAEKEKAQSECTNATLRLK